MKKVSFIEKKHIVFSTRNIMVSLKKVFMALGTFALASLIEAVKIGNDDIVFMGVKIILSRWDIPRDIIKSIPIPIIMVIRILLTISRSSLI